MPPPPPGAQATAERHAAFHRPATPLLDRVFPPDQCDSGPPTPARWSTREAAPCSA